MSICQNDNNWLACKPPSLLERVLCKAMMQFDGVLDTMPMDCLHLTLCFVGERLRHAKPVVQQQVVRRLQDFEKVILERSAQPFILTGFELFPPGKENLLIARFRCDTVCESDVHSLQTDVSRILAFPPQLSPPSFVPHITLGKFRGLTNAQRPQLVARISVIAVPAPSPFPADTSGWRCEVQGKPFVYKARHRR